MTWYASNLEVKGDSQAVYPSCVWITAADPANGRKAHDFPDGFALHMMDFVGENMAKGYLSNPSAMCGGPRFKSYPSFSELNCVPFFNPPLRDASADISSVDLTAPNNNKVACQPGPDRKATRAEMVKLEKWSSHGGPTYGVRKREAFGAEIQPPKNQSSWHNQLIISHKEIHSAKELCESKTSAGPDFISTKEGFYCDMTQRKLLPLCSATLTSRCFHLGTKKLVPGGGPRRRAVQPSKSYDVVSSWD
jgi:hypothetical protein